MNNGKELEERVLQVGTVVRALVVLAASRRRYDFGLGNDGDIEDGGDGDGIMDVEEEDRRGELPSMLQHIIVPSLPSQPYPVDPYHFYCKDRRTNSGAGNAAAEVTSMLAALFEDCGIEAIFHPLKCKFKCLKYVHYSHVEFCRTSLRPPTYTSCRVSATQGKCVALGWNVSHSLSEADPHYRFHCVTVFTELRSETCGKG
ncbi:hypothetical protein PsorP6_004667 [Peronosclerospora sorghi]|uniref:Uncharacterized protein n=1 Tax=Peronosclerospora sorghi TaxID=230839 RepID=A0ACC0VQ19_9STRA|nr:hypothetical protein PsorP6_004667 [Peronosclerospora sorghi]